MNSLKFFFKILLSISFPLLVFRNNVLMAIYGQKKSILRVLIYHNIMQKDYSNFLRQLHWLKKRWNIVTPEEFEAMLENKTLISGRNVLITFDDGFKSNKFIADKYLNPLGIKSIFFVVSDFVNQSSASEAKKFVSNFILEGSSIESMDDTMVNMTWEDLSLLSKEGHTIGAHTKTHKRLSEVLTKKQMITEVLESANSIEKKLSINVTNFAYTFGDISSFSLDALKCAATKFSYVHTGLRGNNVNEASLLSIRRDAVSPADPPLLLGYCLEGGFDFIYKKKLEVYRDWVSTLND